MPPPGDTHDRTAPTGIRQRNPEQLVESLAALLRNASIYLPTHPRVVERAEDFATKIAPWIEAPSWFGVRVRGDDVVVDRTVVPGKSQPVQWMVRRFRDAGVAGVEFGAKVDPAAAIEFARALTSSNARRGRSFAEVWPQKHGKIRPLDLVFTGQHGGTPGEPGGEGVVAAAEAGDVATAGTAAQDVWKIGVVSRLSRAQPIIDRMHAIEHVCEQVAPASGTPTESIDVIASIVDLLPADVVNDPARVETVVMHALDQIQLGIARLLRDGAEVDDANLVRSALGVAKKYFGKSAGDLAAATELPTGRPEDERITPDVECLVAELAALPAGTGLALPPASECTASAPVLATELCGIYLHMLSTSPRRESQAALATCLPKTLDALGSAAYPILDRYMERPAGFSEKNTDAPRLQLLAFLEHAGRAEVAHARGYVDEDLLARTFPESLPIAARLLQGPGRIGTLRSVLFAVGTAKLATGADALRASGALQDPVVLEAIVAVGGELVLPLMQRLASAEQPAAQAAVVAYLRTLRLPPAEAAVLRSHEASELPARYLVDLCRLAASVAASAAANAAPAETRVLPQTGQLLRVLAAKEQARLERRLIAIAGLVYVLGPETDALLERIARTGRFTQWGASARRLRQQAREALWRRWEGDTDDADDTDDTDDTDGTDGTDEKGNSSGKGGA